MEELLAELTKKYEGVDARADAAGREVPKPEWKTTKCGRCDGAGEAHFIGADRAPGVCFRCGGLGVVPRPGKDAGIAKRFGLTVSLTRFRFMYREYRKLLPELQEAAEKFKDDPNPRRWRFQRLVETCEQALKSVEVHGKQARKELDARTKKP